LGPNLASRKALSNMAIASSVEADIHYRDSANECEKCAQAQ
jgi:hypothetical protein